MTAKQDANQQLVYACKQGNMAEVQRVFASATIGHHYLKDTVLVAQDHPEILPYLLEQISKHIDSGVLLGNLIECCPLSLFEQAVPYLSQSQKKLLLIGAVYKNDMGLCDYLLDVGVRPNINCLMAAIEMTNPNFLTVFIALTDPKAQDNWALRTAADNQWQEGVDILWPVSDPKAALAFMKSQSYMTPFDFRLIEERLQQERERIALTQAVDNLNQPSIKRKM